MSNPAAMEHQLLTREFFVAGRYTIADIVLCAYTQVAPRESSHWRPNPRSGCGLSASPLRRGTSRSARDRPAAGEGMLGALG